MTEATQESVPMRVGGVVVDPNTQVPVVVLRGIAEPRLYLPIFIGGLEATAIASVLASVKMPRPMTHDLMTTLLDAVQCRVAKVEVTRLEAGTFYAEITLADQHGGELVLDSRPSDALALALRTEAPIVVNPAVLAEAGALAPEETPAEPPPGEGAGPGEASGARAGAASAAGAAGASEGGAPTGEAPAQGVTPPAADEGPRAFWGTDDVNLEELRPEDFGKYKM